MKRIAKFVTNGNNAIKSKEVDTMEIMSNAQQEVNVPATETAATPQVAEQQLTEKVGIVKRITNGVKSAGKKAWDNRGKIAFVGGVISTVATAIAINKLTANDNTNVDDPSMTEFDECIGEAQEPLIPDDSSEEQSEES